MSGKGRAQFSRENKMIRSALFASALALALPAASAAAQQTVLPVQPISGTRLDIVATGEVSRVPDIARINAGVVTQARTATEAIAQNGERMNRVIAALERAGIDERDIQTSSINLNPEYRYVENQAPILTGYRASNEVTVRFRDIAQTGKILDALVAEGANQINGPMWEIDNPDEALNEARLDALEKARERAELYARATGKGVGDILSISESASFGPPVPMPVMRMEAAAQDASTKIVPGEQTLSVTLSVTYELE
jgi:uncharacterized protein